MGWLDCLPAEWLDLLVSLFPLVGAGLVLALLPWLAAFAANSLLRLFRSPL